jgi:enterochelin esterase-like enzyme
MRASHRRKGRRVAAVVALLGLGLLVASAMAAAHHARSGVTARALTGSFQSKALKSRLHFLIWLPSGYATSGLRYPIVYFLHGLPAGPTSYRTVSWVESALERTGRQAILVVPQGTRRRNGDPEYHDWGPGRDWETALAVELPSYVDAHYRTLATRRGRAIVGVSAGGYGAAILGLQHPATYAVIESWSGYFRPTDPTGEKTLDLGSKAANARASVAALVPSLAQQFRRDPTFFAFYVGRSDPTFVPDNVSLDRELRSARVPHVFELYPGGHTQTLWSAHAACWLNMALDHLSGATR